jgi:chemotaxis methyl-accepting protein methylase
VLIYLRRDAQEAAQRRLVASLAPGGLLFLGEAEWPAPSVAPLLAVVDGAARLFARTPEPAS